MPIRTFSVGPKKSLVKAECAFLPDLVIITGANGAGKSSLLSLLRNVTGETPTDKIMYIGAYRPWRKGTLSKSSSLNFVMSYNQFLSQTNIPHGLVGLPLQNFQGTLRDIDSSDEANSLVKVSLAKLQDKFKDMLAILYQQDGEVRKGKVGDPFSPIKILIRRLLPHLIFHGIEEVNVSNLTVLFRSSYRPDAEPFDIDELSAGEKAIISLFLPVLEFQIEKIIGVVHPSNARTFLIDEPESHLHPALQADMLAYMRELTKSEKIQFVMASHSPSIIDSALQDELFMILPWQEVAGGNQFVHVADSFERLTAIKELSGSAFAYSRGRPILFIEGEYPSDTKKATDLGILELLLPEIRGYIVVPSHGKSQAIASAKAIRRASAEQGHVTTAFALVDSDYDPDNPPWVLPWPVCMIENLLLDMSSIAKLVEPYQQRGAADFDGLNRYLQALLLNMENGEIERRLKSEAKVVVSRPSYNTAGNIVFDEDATNAEMRKVAAQVNLQKDQIRALVRSQLQDGTAHLRFHGKTILRTLFDAQVANFIPQYTNFIFQLAQTIAVDGKALLSARSSIRKIRDYFPPELRSFLVKPELADICKDGPIDLARLQEWSQIRSRVFEGKQAGAQPDYAAERELIKLLSFLRQVGAANSFAELRPLIVDCVSK